MVSGPLGIGGLYRIDMSNPVTPVIEQFLDLSTLGIGVGTNQRQVGDLLADKNDPNRDPLVFIMSVRPALVMSTYLTMRQHSL